MKTILLKFAAPMQSWGTDSHFETRDTDRYPSKSAVIGMIAAALGYRRDEDEKLEPLRHLSFAVRVDQAGGLLKDFQTAAKHKVTKERVVLDRNYVTERYYLQDAAFVVAIGSDDEKLMKEIDKALRAPYFPLYLGRRSLPINPDYMLEINDDDIIDNLKNLKWQASLEYQRHHPNVLDVWADSDLLNNTYYKMARDVPISFAQGRTDSSFNHTDRRKYNFRSIGHKVITVSSDVK